MRMRCDKCLENLELRLIPTPQILAFIFFQKEHSIHLQFGRKYTGFGKVKKGMGAEDASFII